ncbi:restriction endonuclease subunit S [Vibrio sp. 1978]|uniref:restriction endonuclease subunit S n=1 Tax=Vibrio sp. 1978 TaxID=3074585 RepID=UPI002966197C|nr:restriction endonuclease subunit S [Vibrio sp. 1978]MDW3057869.1 restriction endonuclease subunit S [Vibrio sp. 1978]
MSFEKKPITEIVDFNPKRAIKKGSVAPFIDMAALPVSSRDVDEITEKEFKSGGAKFCNGDTLFARITPCLENGKTAKVSGLDKNQNGFGSTEFIVMSAKDQEHDEDYVYYLARLPEFRAYAKARMEGTSGRQRVPWQSLAEFEYPLPSKEQRKLAGNFFRAIDDKISLNTQTNQTLEQMAQAIFKSWFVDFDPVKAKINGEQPEGMDAATASLFPEKLVESELGLIPEGWNLSEIGDEVTVVGGGTPSKKNDDFWVDGHIHWTSPKDLSGVQEKVLLDTASKLTEAGLKKVSSGLLPVDTVLLSSRAPVGYLALAKVPLAVNQGYIAMKCEKVLPPEFVLQWCVHRMDEIKQRASGSTFAEISKKNFKPISVVVPNEEVLIAYKKLVKPLYDAITSNVRQSEQLSTLRDTLLPKLLSGAVTISE